jgi:hypothetical protein
MTFIPIKLAMSDSGRRMVAAALSVFMALLPSLATAATSIDTTAR